MPRRREVSKARHTLANPRTDTLPDLRPRAANSPDERRNVERGDPVRGVRRWLCRNDEQRLAGRHAGRKPLRMLSIVHAIGDLLRGQPAAPILNEDGVGQAVDLVAGAVRFKREPVAVGRPPAGARLENLQEARAARRALVKRRYDREPRAPVRYPDVVDVLVVIVAHAIVLAGERDQVRVNLIDARETGPDEVAPQFWAYRIARGIDLGGDQGPGHVRRNELAVRIPRRIDHAGSIWELDRIRRADGDDVDAFVVAESDRSDGQLAAGSVPAPVRPRSGDRCHEGLGLRAGRRKIE